MFFILFLCLLQRGIHGYVGGKFGEKSTHSNFSIFKTSNSSQEENLSLRRNSSYESSSTIGSIHSDDFGSTHPDDRNQNIFPLLQPFYSALQTNERTSFYDEMLSHSFSDLSRGIVSFIEQIKAIKEEGFQQRTSLDWFGVFVPLFFRDIFFSILKIFFLSLVRFFSPDLFRLITSFTVFSLLG